MSPPRMLGTFLEDLNENFSVLRNFLLKANVILSVKFKKRRYPQSMGGL